MARSNSRKANQGQDQESEQQGRRWQDENDQSGGDQGETGGELAGEARQTASDWMNSISDAITSRPMTSLLIALGVGFILAGGKKRRRG
jgi:hypothetical protein